MIILEYNYRNMRSLNSVYVHDSEFTGFSHYYDHRTVELSCTNAYIRKKQTFIFENVIVLHMQSCSFWNGGNSIAWMTVSDRTEYLDRLIEIQSNNSQKYEGSYLDQGIRYIAVEFTINSGDTLLIVCQKIHYTEMELVS